MNKILYFDVETTGLDAVKNDITQLAGILEIDGKEVERFNFDVKPFDMENVSKEALEVTGKTMNDLEGYTDPRIIYNKFTIMLSRYVDKYDRNDKIIPAGYNVNFDIQFLRNFFLKNNDVYFGSFFNYRYVDPLAVLYWCRSLGYIELESYKLESVCKHFDIEIDAHDALSDIEATKALNEVLIGFVVDNFNKRKEV